MQKTLPAKAAATAATSNTLFWQTKKTAKNKALRRIRPRKRVSLDIILSKCMAMLMRQLCGQFIMLVLLVHLLHAIIGVLKLSLVLHDVKVSLRFYLILVRQVLILCCITVRLFLCVHG